MSLRRQQCDVRLLEYHRCHLTWPSCACDERQRYVTRKPTARPSQDTFKILSPASRRACSVELGFAFPLHRNSTLRGFTIGNADDVSLLRFLVDCPCTANRPACDALKSLSLRRGRHRRPRAEVRLKRSAATGHGLLARFVSQRLEGSELLRPDRPLKQV